jgi:hypothetical protein
MDETFASLSSGSVLGTVVFFLFVQLQKLQKKSMGHSHLIADWRADLCLDPAYAYWWSMQERIRSLQIFLR